jgi:hypothetical protein
MKKIVIAYWLLPGEPERSFFQQLINDLGQRYSAPVFEPHLTIHVGTNCANTAEKALATAARHCKPVTLKRLKRFRSITPLNLSKHCLCGSR